MGTHDKLSDDQKRKLWERCQKDPVFFALHVLGIEQIEDYQAKVLKAIASHERVAVRSCHNMGKTWGAGVAVLWFTPTHPRSKLVSTAPTSRQVRLLLWGEIGAGYAKSRYPLGGELTTTEWKIQPDWWAAGFTTQKEAAHGEGQANSGFQGVHAEWIFVIFDEATGISTDIWKQLEGFLTSANVRFLALGNPTTKSCEFYKCFSDSSYKKIHLSCFDSPNLIANGIVDMTSLQCEHDALLEMNEEARLNHLDSYKIVRPHLLTAKWVMAKALAWGLDHPLFVSKALGEFPDEDERCLMPLGVVESSQQRKIPKAKKSDKHFFGVDVARYGGDISVITHQRESVVVNVEGLVKRAIPEVSGAVIRLVNKIPDNERQVVITVDATGIGSGVVDELKLYKSKNELKWRNVTVVELHFGETFKEGRDGTKDSAKQRTEKYVNKKAEMYVLLAEDLKTDLVLPTKSDFYLEELPTIAYKFDKSGRWIIESKDEYKKRTGRKSPDYADSLALGNYGRHHTGGVGTFTDEMAKPTGKPLAGRLVKGDDD